MAQKRRKSSKSKTRTPSVNAKQSQTAGTVKKSGFLSKIGGFVKKALPVAAKLLPGVGGTVSKIASGIFNDPEWWQHVPGNGLSTNIPLSTLSYSYIYGSGGDRVTVSTPRAAILELSSYQYRTADQFSSVIQPTDEMIGSYLMPPIRRVVNAVSLQPTASYTRVFKVGASVYALWQHLKKLRYLAEHGLTYMPDLFDGSYPILATENKAYLDALIQRLEEKLRSSIRLPHTLCQYLAWRYGRCYKSNPSAKSALVMYNPIGLTAAISAYDTLVAKWFAVLTADAIANTDMYNAFVDHDQRVEVSADSQISYDCKEFVLRTNMDIAVSGNSQDTEFGVDNEPDIIIMDSELDNKTVFMASTVSTLGRDPSGEQVNLFPITLAMVHAYNPPEAFQGAYGFSRLTTNPGLWYQLAITPSTAFPTYQNGTTLSNGSLAIFLAAAMCKQVDLYNAEQYIAFRFGTTADLKVFDLTAISIDTGYVQNTVIANEQKYAFANLMHYDTKRYETTGELTRDLELDTARLINEVTDDKTQVSETKVS